MAQDTIGTKDDGGKAIPEWQKDRIEIAALVGEHILDPIMSFAELVRGYDSRKGINFTLDEISRVLRLLVIGGHAEMKLYGVTGDSWCHISGKNLDDEIREWLKAAATMKKE